MLFKIAYDDWKIKKIHNRDILFIFLAGTAGTWVLPEISFFQKCIGIFVVSVPLILLVLLIPGGIGGGDIKLMAAGGFLLGNGRIWNAFCIGILLSGIYVLFLLANKKADQKTEIALGPFLCIGMSLMLIFTYVNPAF